MSKAMIVGLQSTAVVLGLTGAVMLITSKILGIQFSVGALLGTMSIMVLGATSAAYKQGVKDSQIARPSVSAATD